MADALFGRAPQTALEAALAVPRLAWPLLNTFCIVTPQTARLLEIPAFDVLELADRWRKARVQALRSLRPELEATEGEGGLLEAIPAESRELALRRVFDSSRAFGRSFVRFFNVTPEISDFAELLPHTGIPCFSAPWKKHKDAQVLERKGCASLKALGAFGCDYWREALDGFVMGAGENERLSRHRSQGHGDESCLDVLFTEEVTIARVVSGAAPTARRSDYKYGPIPIEMTERLAPVAKRFADMKVTLVLVGLSEGVLQYRLDAQEGVLCGPGGKLLHDSFTEELAKFYPGMSAKDAAPLAVYGSPK